MIDALEQSLFARDTVVVLWSDHGYQLGVDKLSQAKWGCGATIATSSVHAHSHGHILPTLLMTIPWRTQRSYYQTRAVILSMPSQHIVLYANPAPPPAPTHARTLALTQASLASGVR